MVAGVVTNRYPITNANISAQSQQSIVSEQRLDLLADFLPVKALFVADVVTAHGIKASAPQDLHAVNTTTVKAKAFARLLSKETSLHARRKHAERLKRLGAALSVEDQAIIPW